MPRWRPSKPKSSPYITAEGERLLREELKELWLRRRREIVPAMKAAAAEGDRSENAEYTYRKKQLGEVDRRIRYLSKRLDEVEVVHHAPRARDRIFFGAWIMLRDSSGAAMEYRIVGADEIDAAKGYISVDSPMARALLGREAGDSVCVDLPNGSSEFEILEIRYS